MTTQDAQILADLANAAEAAMLAQMTNAQRDTYMSLPREARTQIAMDAATATIKALK